MSHSKVAPHAHYDPCEEWDSGYPEDLRQFLEFESRPGFPAYMGLLVAALLAVLFWGGLVLLILR